MKKTLTILIALTMLLSVSACGNSESQKPTDSVISSSQVPQTEGSSETVAQTSNLVTIHPWVDGNGRTARLLMNYIQFCYNLFPTKIFKEDREEYISALRQSQEEETNLPFLGFMAVQLKKSLSLEIERFKTSQKKIFSFMF